MEIARSGCSQNDTVRPPVCLNLRAQHNTLYLMLLSIPNRNTIIKMNNLLYYGRIKISDWDWYQTRKLIFRLSCTGCLKECRSTSCYCLRTGLDSKGAEDICNSHCTWLIFGWKNVNSVQFLINLFMCGWCLQNWVWFSEFVVHKGRNRLDRQKQCLQMCVSGLERQCSVFGREGQFKVCPVFRQL